jgi:hypothetical protein
MPDREGGVGAERGAATPRWRRRTGTLGAERGSAVAKAGRLNSFQKTGWLQRSINCKPSQICNQAIPKSNALPQALGCQRYR